MRREKYLIMHAIQKDSGYRQAGEGREQGEYHTRQSEEES